MWFRMWRISALWVMKAMMRICPPHMGHSSGNLGNAIGAWLGGAVITAGWSLQAIPLVAAAVTLSALALTAYIAWLDRQPAAQAPVLADCKAV